MDDGECGFTRAVGNDGGRWSSVPAVGARHFIPLPRTFTGFLILAYRALCDSRPQFLHLSAPVTPVTLLFLKQTRFFPVSEPLRLLSPSCDSRTPRCWCGLPSLFIQVLVQINTPISLSHLPWVLSEYLTLPDAV